MTPKALSPESLTEEAFPLTPEEWRRVLAHIAALEADNAALLVALTKTRDELDEMVGVRAGQALRIACSQTHPGAALLERHEKALVRARNEGRDEAIREIQRARGKTPPGSMAHSLLRLAEDASMAMMEPER